MLNESLKDRRVEYMAFTVGWPRQLRGCKVFTRDCLPPLLAACLVLPQGLRMHHHRQNESLTDNARGLNTLLYLWGDRRNCDGAKCPPPLLGVPLQTALCCHKGYARSSSLPRDVIETGLIGDQQPRQDRELLAVY